MSASKPESFYLSCCTTYVWPPAELHAQGTCHSLTAARTPFGFTGSVELQFLRIVDTDKKIETLYLFQLPASIFSREGKQTEHKKNNYMQLMLLS
jgi:hypothetical protein